MTWRDRIAIAIASGLLMLILAFVLCLVAWVLAFRVGLSRLGVLLLVVVMGGCAHQPPIPEAPKEPGQYALLPASLPGEALFCVEAPTFNSYLEEPRTYQVVCPWNVDEVRRMVARLRAAD